MNTSFHKIYNIIIQECQCSGHKKKSKKKKKNGGCKAVYMPSVGYFDSSEESTVEEYYITHDKIRADVEAAAGASHIETRYDREFALIQIGRQYAPQFLKTLKNKGYVCTYRYPVENPSYIMIFSNEDTYKKLKNKNMPELRGFVRY